MLGECRTSTILLPFLLFCALLFLLSLFFTDSRRASLPKLSWAPGYWEVSPLIGHVRIIPLAGCRLRSPAVPLQELPEVYRQSDRPDSPPLQ